MDHNQIQEEAQAEELTPFIASERSQTRNRYDPWQYQIWNTLEQDEATPLGRFVNLIIVLLIFISIFSVIATADEWLLEKHPWISWLAFGIEYFSVGVFTIEYLLILLTCTGRNCTYYRSSSIIGRICFVCSLSSVIDLLSIVSAYVSLVLFVHGWIKGDRSMYAISMINKLVSLRLLRILRLLKAEKYIHGIRFITITLQQLRMELLISFFLIFMFVMFSSALIYVVETTMYVDPDTGLRRPNPEFTSLPECIYWTLTTAAIELGPIQKLFLERQ